MTWFGNIHTWMLLGMAWIIGAIVVSLLFSVMTQVEDRMARWRKERHGEAIQPEKD